MDDIKQLSGLKARRKRKKIIRILLSAVLIALLLGGIFYLISTNFLIVKKITVQENELYSAESILSSSGIVEGKPLLSLPVKKIRAKLEDEYFFLQDIQVKLVFPDEVRISFREDKGEMKITLGGDTYFLDEELNVLSRAKVGDPEVHRMEIRSGDVKRCIVGEKIEFSDPTLINMMFDVYDALAKEGIADKVNLLDASDKFSIRIDFDSRFVVQLGEYEDIPYKLAMLQKVVAELDAESRGQIDLTDANEAYVRITG